MSCCRLSFHVVGQMVRRGEDERKAQPDVASLVLRLPAIRGACCRGRGSTATGREGGGAQGLGGPEPGQRSSRTGSERAAAGRAGPAEVKGRGLPGCLWGGEPTGVCKPPVGSSREKESWEEREGRETLGIAGVGFWIQDLPPRHRDKGYPQRGGDSECAGLLQLGPAKFFFPSLR